MAKFIIKQKRNGNITFAKQGFTAGGGLRDRSVMLRAEDIAGWASYKSITENDLRAELFGNIVRMLDRMKSGKLPDMSKIDPNAPYKLEVEIEDAVDAKKYSVDQVGPDTFSLMMNTGAMDDWFDIKDSTEVA